ncbi:MAG: aminotransferase class V-fold PLP-dependent enzyme [Campylobacteraceae bacterium]
MIYLDNAATSFPKPECVTKAVTHFLINIGANPGRSANTLSIKSAGILYETRKKLTKFINGEDIFRTIFTLNATSAINTCLYGILNENDTVLITSLEHNAIIRPLNELKKQKNINIKIIKASQNSKIDLDEMREMAKGVKLISCVHVNNVTGAILPILEISKIAKENGALFLVDASQSVGLLDIDMQKLSIDFLCASAHKHLYAPMGLGFFSFSKNIDIKNFRSFYQGGTGSKSEEIIQPELLPDKYESGTINMPAIAGLLKSLEWIEEKGVKDLYNHEMTLRDLLLFELKKSLYVKVCEVYEGYKTTGILSFYTENKKISEVAKKLNDFEVLCRVGLHCSPLTHESIKTLKHGGTIRLAPSFFTSKDEIIKAAKIIKEIVDA